MYIHMMQNLLLKGYSSITMKYVHFIKTYLLRLNAICSSIPRMYHFSAYLPINLLLLKQIEYSDYEYVMSSIKKGVTEMDRNLLDNIEKSTGVKTEEIMKVVKSFQNANFSDEKTVRNVIRNVAKVANKPVSKQLENKLVDAIVRKNIPSLDQIKKNFR